jgi:signal transduction histidine kinase
MEARIERLMPSSGPVNGGTLVSVIGVGLSSETTSHPGLGLPSMQARAQALGATLTLGPGDEGGATLSMRWPIS